MRIFLGLAEIASYYVNLVSGLEDEGVEAVFVDLSGNPYRYEGVGSKPRWICVIESWLQVLRGGAGIGVSPRKILWAAVRMVLKVPIGLWAVWRFDILVLGAGTHFAGYYELALMRFLGKRSVVIFHGTDARPPYLSGRFVAGKGPIPAARLARRTRRMKNKISRAERWATVIVNHPPTAQLADRPFVQWLWLGVPMKVPADREGIADMRSVGLNEPTRILHAPTSPTEKGTPEIRNAIESLRRAGKGIEYIEMIGRPNSEVLAEISKCDFVVDEIFSDTLLAGLGTEAASLAKPVLVGGYELKALRDSLNWPAPPSIAFLPDSVEDAILESAAQPERIRNLGVEAREFVAEHWSPSQVARRFLETLQHGPPHEALFDPLGNTFCAGWGLRRERASEAVRAIVQYGGEEALCISSPITLQAVLGRAEPTDPKT